MTRNIQLISTDFDGTIFAELDTPPVPTAFFDCIAQLQHQGARWIINTGREFVGVEAALELANFPVRPDFIISVEREIHARQNGGFRGVNPWNECCHRQHLELFQQVRPELPGWTAWIQDRYAARLFEDAYSPLCIITQSNPDMDAIQAYLVECCRRVPGLDVVRNDVYARLCHQDFNKGTALAEVTRLLGLSADHVFAAGDHLNDLPMLSRRHARWLAAPANAVPAVKVAVRQQGGYLSRQPCGLGVLEALEFCLRQSE